jgi:glyoxylase-like metal-dependent hydrolase (beta-lactamase superfamily II)
MRLGEIELIELEIHSDDATVLWWPARRLLFAGDTLEDTLTYVAAPDRLPRHLDGLERLRALGAERILPNHGAPERIAAGGYPPGFIAATSDYVRALLDPARRQAPLRELLAGPLAAGWITYYEPYEAVRAENLAAVSSGTATD